MADVHRPDAGDRDAGPVGPEGSTGPVIRDKRRVDPETGAVRHPEGEAAAATGDEVVPDDLSGLEAAFSAAAADMTEQSTHPDTVLAAERLVDLQRLQAEYVNYKRRVDRDRELHRDAAIGSVIEALLPVLDDIHLARQHGDLEGTPFAAIADKLDATLAKFGVARFGEPGEPFDPAHHEALMHVEAELAQGTEETTVVQVLQPGYKVNDRLIRAARVSVADPT
ncbi:MAG TPA: nucleotide exchange factor GrpE [Dermatophilaceae bacterium]|nr:nucleotide exchange factor GrpE [Dermatophilaceae bacterium]